MAAALLVAAGCGSSSKSTSSASSPTPAQSTPTQSASASASGGRTYTIGVLTDLTGPASATYGTLTAGLKAGIGVAATEGYHIKYILADTQSTPAGALAGAQKLVDEDHVFAVILISDLGFGAAPYLKSKGIPVIGAAVDSTEWTTDRNMFSIFGTPDYTKVETTTGLFFKLAGATNVGAIGYGIVPSAADYALGTAVSARAAGLKVGYINAQFPLGSTNVGPEVLAMKSAGIDGLLMLVQQNTSFAILSALRQQGADVKVPLLSAGYGADLLSSGPAALHDSQNVYFGFEYEPIEMNTPATQKFANALKTYAGSTEDPGLAGYLAYISIDALSTGLKATGPNPTQAQFIDSMLGITDYNAAGLFGDHSMSFAMSARGFAPGAGDCQFFTKFQGSTFHLVPGADPICGSIIPGAKVSSS